ncbi:MAG: hypothetical protein AAF639_15800 [Chloroflexota bacterium]
MSNTIPSWVQPHTHPQWPTTIISSQDLAIELPIPSHWQSMTAVSETNLGMSMGALKPIIQKEQTYAGATISDWVSIRLIENAPPAQSLESWVNSFLQLIGFPTVIPNIVGEATGKLLSWEEYGQCPTLAQQWRVDNVSLYQGLARLSTPQSTELAHLYIALARRKRRSWNISLSASSACLPTMPEELIAANDHVRAGATLGHVQFYA